MKTNKKLVTLTVYENVVKQFITIALFIYFQIKFNKICTLLKGEDIRK